MKSLSVFILFGLAFGGFAHARAVSSLRRWRQVWSHRDVLVMKNASASLVISRAKVSDGKLTRNQIENGLRYRNRDLNLFFGDSSADSVGPVIDYRQLNQSNVVYAYRIQIGARPFFIVEHDFIQHRQLVQTSIAAPSLDEARSAMAKWPRNYDPWERVPASEVSNDSQIETHSDSATAAAVGGCQFCDQEKSIIEKTIVPMLSELNKQITPQCSVKNDFPKYLQFLKPGPCRQAIIKSNEELISFVWSSLKYGGKWIFSSSYRLKFNGEAATLIHVIWQNRRTFGSQIYNLAKTTVEKKFSRLRNCSKEYRAAFICKVALDAIGAAIAVLKLKTALSAGEAVAAASGKVMASVTQLPARSAATATVKAVSTAEEVPLQMAVGDAASLPSVSAVKPKTPPSLAKVMVKEIKAQADAVEASVNPKAFLKDAQMRIWRLRENGNTKAADELEVAIKHELKHGIIKGQIHEELTDGSTAVIYEFRSGLKAVCRDHSTYRTGKYNLLAYDIDRELELNKFPVTVERVIDGQRTVMELFIEGPDNRPLVDSPRPFSFVDSLIGNSDRHTNYKVMRGGRLAGYDHEMSFENGENRPRRAPSFANEVKNTLNPVEEKRHEIELLKASIERAAHQYGSETPSFYRATDHDFRDLKHAIHEERAIYNENLGELVTTMPSKRSYELLKNKTPGGWRQFLQSKGASDAQINRFLKTRQDNLTAIDQAIEIYGDNAFAAGPHSPLVQQAYTPQATVIEQPESEQKWDDAVDRFLQQYDYDENWGKDGDHN